MRKIHAILISWFCNLKILLNFQVKNRYQQTKNSDILKDERTIKRRLTKNRQAA